MAKEKIYLTVFLAVALACCPWPRPLPLPNSLHTTLVYHDTLDLLTSPQQAEEAPVEIEIEEGDFSERVIPVTSDLRPRVFWRGQPKFMPNLPICLSYFLYPHQYGSRFRWRAPLAVKMGGGESNGRENHHRCLCPGIFGFGGYRT